jgi:hypothetical protein
MEASRNHESEGPSDHARFEAAQDDSTRLTAGRQDGRTSKLRRGAGETSPAPGYPNDRNPGPRGRACSS